MASIVYRFNILCIAVLSFSLLLCFSNSGCVSTGAGRPPHQEAVEEGQGDVNSLESAIEWKNKAEEYQRDKLFDFAIGAYEKAIKIDPGYVKPYSNLGWIYISRGDYEKGKSYVDEALAIDPDYVDALVSLAAYYEIVGSEKLSFATFQRALEIDPKNVRAHNNLGILYEKLGEHDKALESYGNVIILAPMFPNPYINTES